HTHYEQPAIPCWKVRNQIRNDARTKARVDREHLQDACEASRGHRQSFTESTRRAIPPGRLDRPSGRPPPAGQPSQCLYTVQTGADRSRADNQALRRKPMGNPGRWTAGRSGDLVIPAGCTASTMGDFPAFAGTGRLRAYAEAS